MVFRSSSLLVTFLIGRAVGKKYSLYHFLAVVVVTLGILAAMNAEREVQISKAASKIHNSISPSSNLNSSLSSPSGTEAADGYSTWLLGVLMLSVALFLYSALGFMQEYGTHTLL